jgi:acyl carrier protein
MAEASGSVRDVVLDTVASYFDVPRDTLSDATTSQDVDGWDSTTHIPLMLEIEDRLDMEFPLERLGSMETLGDLIRLGEEVKAEQAA